RSTAEKRPRSAPLADPRRAPHRDRALDRTHLPPASPPEPARTIDPHRIRDHHEPGRAHRGLTPRLSPIGAAVPWSDSYQDMTARPCCTVREPGRSTRPVEDSRWWRRQKSRESDPPHTTIVVPLT